MNFKLLPDEEIIFESRANRMRFSIFAQGGKLYLTNKRLVFVGHGVNVGEGTISINFEDILTFRKALALGIFIPIPNAIKVTTQNGKTHKFIVSKRRHWVRELQKVLNT